MDIHKVVRRFDDKNGHGGVYEEGDVYIHADRFDVLSSKENKQKKVYTKPITVVELKAELTEREIEFEDKLKRDDLVELLHKQLAGE